MMSNIFYFKENHGYQFLVHDSTISSFEVISVHEDNFLVLGIGKFRQSIFLCNNIDDQVKLLAQYNLTTRVVSATVNVDEKLLLVVQKKTNNGFIKKEQYCIVCVMYEKEPKIEYPVSSCYETEPKVEWFSPKMFYVSTIPGELEGWEISCSKVKFNMVRKKQFDFMSYWERLNGNLRIVTGIDSETRSNTYPILPKLVKFNNDNKVSIDLPNVVCNYNQIIMLEGLNTQTILIMLEDTSIDIIFSNSGSLVKSKFDNVNISEYSLQKFVFLSSDLLFLRLPTNELLCILFNGNGLCSCFRLQLSDQVKRLEMTSNSRYYGINCINGNQYSFDFNYKVITEFYPEFFTHFLHYYFTKYKKDTIFSFLNYNIVKIHWDGIIFEEYFLLLLINNNFSSLNNSNSIRVITNDVKTFCIPYKSKNEKVVTMKSKKYNFIRNWKSMLTSEKYQKIFTQTFCSQISKFVLQIPINSVPQNLKLFVNIQILSLYFKFYGTFDDSDVFQYVQKYLPKGYNSYWEYIGIFPIGYQYKNSQAIYSKHSLFNNKSTQKSWWSFRTDLKKCDVYERKPMINMTAHIFYSIENLCQNQQLKKTIPPYFTNFYSN